MASRPYFKVNTNFPYYTEEYDAFMDIEFNPAKSLNCQARAAAMYVSLKKVGLLGCVDSIETFCAVVSRKPKGAALSKKKEVKIRTLEKGETVIHPKFGEGVVLEVCGSRVKIRFRAGEKLLTLAFVKENCRKKVMQMPE